MRLIAVIAINMERDLYTMSDIDSIKQLEMHAYHTQAFLKTFDKNCTIIFFYISYIFYDKSIFGSFVIII